MAEPISPALERGMPTFSEFVAMMGALMALTALSIDIMLPALPQIREAMALADENQQQLVVTLYLLGFAVGQLFHGPLSDRFGRKPVLLAGLSVYAAASFACTIVGEFTPLLVARFIQGAANAAPRVIAVAVVRDVYGGRRMAEVMSFVMMVFIIAPVVAPSLGGGLLLVGDWHVVFAFLTAFAVAVLGWMALRLPETRPAAMREPMSPVWLFRAFREAVTTRQTLCYTLATGAVFGSLMGYVNSAQQLFADVYLLGPLFPLAFGCAAAAIAVASFVNSRIVGRVGMRRVSHLALLGFLATALLHLAIEALTGAPPLGVFLLLLAASLFCFGLVMPNFNAIAMEPMSRIAGTASSFIGAVTTGIAAGLGWAIGQSYDGTLTPLLFGFVAFGALSLLAILVTERGRLGGAAER
jgi:MFS transporter, DHA1 family, multidrug resistance protein